MTEWLFIDTNVFMRIVLDDHPEMSPRARRLLERVALREVRATTSVTVIFELVYGLEVIQRVPKPRVRDAVVPIVSLEALEIHDRDSILLALDWYATHNTPFADAYHAASANRRGIPAVCSFDHHFDRFPGIRRVEP